MKTYVVLLYDDIYDSTYDNIEAARARVEQIEVHLRSRMVHRVDRSGPRRRRASRPTTSTITATWSPEIFRRDGG